MSSRLVSWPVRLIRLTLALFVACFILPGTALAQAAPDDFSFSIESRPTHEYDVDDVYLVTMDASGAVAIKAFELGGQFHEAASLTLDQEARDAIWAQIVESNFFERDSVYRNREIYGGDVATFSVLANGDRHTVQMENYPITSVDRIALILNRHLPPGYLIYYNALYYPETYAPVGED